MQTLNRETGDMGERIACEFLKNKNYSIIEKNFRGGKCEIDIIARKDEYIIFVEVKTRSTKIFGSASQAVGYEKQKNIIKAAKIFLLSKGNLYDNIQPRFDVIEVYTDFKTGKNYVSHIESAFIT